MNVVKTYAGGRRLLLADADEWHALVAAVEIAFDDAAAVPDDMKAAADRLWAATHG